MFFDLPEAIRQQCEHLLGVEITRVCPVGGGDINQTCLLETPTGNFFLKMNRKASADRMFETEAKGLSRLHQANVIRIPAVIASGSTPDGACLLLEYIETGYRMSGFWEEFGTSLAALHLQTTDQFGLDHDNFIGSLPQSNNRHDTWTDFFITERLQPQLDLALQSSQLRSPDAQRFEKLFQRIPEICPVEPPALSHGDLWSGNFMVSADSRPVLVDPAVSYAHREMDLAMSRLFGGFDRTFYRSYEESWPLEPGFEQRLSVYQLYYLMVHVNLFGGGYVGSVRSVLQQFT